MSTTITTAIFCAVPSRNNLMVSRESRKFVLLLPVARRLCRQHIPSHVSTHTRPPKTENKRLRCKRNGGIFGQPETGDRFTFDLRGDPWATLLICSSRVHVTQGSQKHI